MKKITFYISGLFTLFCISCMDDFLNRDPYGSLDEKTYFTKAEHADLAAISCYSTLQHLNKHWADAQLELGMTGDFSSSGFKDAQAFYTASFNPNEANVVNGIWNRGYAAIAICNKNIEGIKQMNTEIIRDDDKNKHLAEVYFIRAFWYFRLIRFYGDIPLRATSIRNPNDEKEVQLPKTSCSEIIKSIIIPDLEFASLHLPIKWNDRFYNRATKGAAYSTLCEAYMYTKEYDKAIEAGLEVEKLGYRLLDNPGDVLRVDFEGNSEIIFSVGYGPGVETFREYYYGTIETLGDKGRIMRGDTYSGDYFYPSKDFIDFFQMIDGKKISEDSPYYIPSESWKYRDPRFDITFFTVMDNIITTKGISLKWNKEWLVNNVTGYDIQKRGVWYGEDNWNKRIDHTLIRLPRIYLLLAEAYALKSNPDFNTCNLYIEKIRGRARNFAKANPDKYLPDGISTDEILPAFKITSRQEAMESINYESRVELFTEDCYRYFDLKRWGTLKEEWPKVGGFQWNDKFYNLPIPSSEINANKQITQDPAWGN